MSERAVGVSGGVGKIEPEVKPEPVLEPFQLAAVAAPIYAMILGNHAGARSGDVQRQAASNAVELAGVLWAGVPKGVPVNVAVPYIEQRGGTLNCTMGEWENRPHGYEYRWYLDGVAVVEEEGGTSVSSADYVIRAGDVGRRATCVVAARNVLGEVAAPPSNEVVVVLP
jgi:uncharacterized cupin superfamily protein